MGKLDDLRQLSVGLIDMHYGVNRIKDAKEDLKVNFRFAVISNLILGAICVGVMYLRFRVFGK